MSKLYDVGDNKRMFPGYNKIRMQDRSIPNSGQFATYGPPRMPKLNLETGEYMEGTTGTFPFQYQKAASLAETARDNPSTYSPPHMPTQTEYGTTGTFQIKAAALDVTIRDNTSLYSPPQMPTQTEGGEFVQGTAGAFQNTKAASLADTVRDNQSPYGPPQMPTQTTPGTVGTFQDMRAASLADTVRDDIVSYGPPKMPTQITPGTAGTFQTRVASLGSTMLGLKGGSPTFTSKLAATDYRVKDAGDRETETQI